MSTNTVLATRGSRRYRSSRQLEAPFINEHAMEGCVTALLRTLPIIFYIGHPAPQADQRGEEDGSHQRVGKDPCSAQVAPTGLLKRPLGIRRTRRRPHERMRRRQQQRRRRWWRKPNAQPP